LALSIFVAVSVVACVAVTTYVPIAKHESADNQRRLRPVVGSSVRAAAALIMETAALEIRTFS